MVFKPVGKLPYKITRNTEYTVDGRNPVPFIPLFTRFIYFRWCRTSSINSSTTAPSTSKQQEQLVIFEEYVVEMWLKGGGVIVQQGNSPHLMAKRYVQNGRQMIPQTPLEMSRFQVSKYEQDSIPGGQILFTHQVKFVPCIPRST